MGMQAHLEQITPQQLAKFVSNPSSAYEHMLAAISQSTQDMLRNIVSDPEEALRKTLAALETRGGPPEETAMLREMFQKDFAQLQSMSKRTSGPQLVGKENKTTPEDEIKVFSLEKDWHVLHYALNGTTEGGEGPLADAVLGGEEIPDVDQVMGYGPMRYLTPAQVEAVAKALAAIDPAALLSKLDYEDAQSKQIYLSHTLDNLDDWSYLPQFFEGFRDFYAEASQNGRAMLLYIT